MNLEIKPVKTTKDLKKFIQFANDLYEDCPYYCPPLWFDEMNVFDVKHNPALEVCDKQLFLAYRDDQIVGRVAALINYKANEHWHVDKVRFGWFDFMDDLEVSHALLDAVKQWGKAKGMKELNGPVGFTDWDHEGLLIEGYEYLAPLASLYNYPYYVRHLEAYGMEKEADWIEYQITPPTQIPDRIIRMSRVVQERSHVHVDKVRSKKELVSKYGISFMDVLDTAYQKLYNFQPMTMRQKEYYRDMYFPLLNFDFVCIVVNDKNEIVGVGVGMPDIAKQVKQCKGRLLPFGWLKLYRALHAKKIDTFDLLLIGVRPDYQSTGIDAVIFADMIPYFIQYGIQKVETTSMLETNTRVHAVFAPYDKIQHKRRRAYSLMIE